MTDAELQRALRQLRLGGMADVLEVRVQQARAENLGPLDFLELLVHDEMERRRDRLIHRRIKRAAFREIKTLDTFDWSFNPGLDRRLVFELATCRYIERHEGVCILGVPGSGKSHIVQALGLAAIHAGYTVLYREGYNLCEEFTMSAINGTRSTLMQTLAEVPLLIVDDIGMRRMTQDAAEDMLELMMRRHQRASTIITSNRPMNDWPRFFADVPAMTAFLDRLLHHGHMIEAKGGSYRMHQNILRRKAEAQERFPEGKSPTAGQSEPPSPRPGGKL